MTHHASSCNRGVAAWQLLVVPMGAGCAASADVLLQDGEGDTPDGGRSAAQPAASRGSNAAANLATSAWTNNLQVGPLPALPV